MRILCIVALLCVLAGLTCAQSPPGNGPQGAIPQTTYSTLPTGSSSSSGASNGTFGTVIDPMTTANGGLKATVKEVFDATFTNLSTTVTTPGTDVACTSADVGTIVFGTNDSPGQGHINANVIVPQGTVQSCTAHSIVVSVAATNNCTPSGGVGCRLLWGGTDQTSALSTAWTNAVTGVGICPAIQYPNGLWFISANPFTAALTCRNANTGTTTTGLVHRGWGRYNSQFVILPSFNWATCTSGQSGQNCFGAANGVQWVDIGITGGGNALVGGNHSVNIMELQTDGLADHVLCEGIGANDAAMVGLRFGAVGEGAIYPIFDGCGGLNADVASGAGIKIGFFGDSIGVSKSGSLVCGMVVEAGTSANSDSTGFGPCGTGTSFGVLNFGTWISSQDQCLNYFSVNFACLGLLGTSTAKLLQWANGTSPGVATNVVIDLLSTTAQVQLSQSNLFVGAGGTGIFCFANGKIFDNGGNSFAGTGAITSCPAASFFGSGSVTGTALIATNVTANTSWGTSGAAGNGISAPLGDSHLFTFTVTAAGVPAANPTLAVTFPTAFWVAPGCSAQQIGGTGAIQALTTTTGPSTTAVTFTWNGTPVAASTYIIQGRCQ